MHRGSDANIAVNGRGDRTTTVYDAAGETVATVDALANRTTQVFDAAGRRIELVDANDITVTFLFDAKGQDVGGIDALGNRVTYQYDGNGQQTLKIDPLAQRMTTVYDAVSRRIEERYADGQRHTFAFDAVGNQVRMADSTGITTSVYDAKNRVTAVINPGNRRVTNSYDAIDRRAVMAEPEGGRFSYSYDAANRLTAIVNPQNKRTTQTFDAADRLVRQQHGNGSLVTNIYDDAGQTTGIINAKSDGTVINRFTYIFDDAGNRLTKAETGGVRTTWAYDGTSQLVHEERNDANALDITHVYDPVGNRTVQIDSGVRTTATYDAGNQLTAEVTNGSRTTFTHDPCGNRTKKEATSATTFYTWDTCRNLTVVEPPAGKVTMTYNAAGKRVRKETAGDTKKFLYDFERLLQESDGADTVEKTYTSTQEQYGDLLSQYDGTDTLYHQYDSLGSTDALVSDAEMATDRYVYRAFGLETHTTGASDNALTFVGKQNYYRDSETDLYFLNARYYDPNAARFISEDPLGYEAGDVNLFRYVGNNPVNATDPSGLQIFGFDPGRIHIRPPITISPPSITIGPGGIGFQPPEVGLQRPELSITPPSITLPNLNQLRRTLDRKWGQIVPLLRGAITDELGADFLPQIARLLAAPEGAAILAAAGAAAMRNLQTNLGNLLGQFGITGLPAQIIRNTLPALLAPAAIALLPALLTGNMGAVSAGALLVGMAGAMAPALALGNALNLPANITFPGPAGRMLSAIWERLSAILRNPIVLDDTLVLLIVYVILCAIILWLAGYVATQTPTVNIIQSQPEGWTQPQIQTEPSPQTEPQTEPDEWFPPLPIDIDIDAPRRRRRCNPPQGFVHSMGTTTVNVSWHNQAIEQPIGVVALVTPQSAGPSDSARDFDRGPNNPTWWIDLTTEFPQPNRNARWQRGHLVGNQLGGPGGQNWWNMVPLRQRANSPVMRQCERRIRQTAERGRGECIDMAVIPIYGNQKVIPISVIIIASSENSNFRLNVTIPNTSTAPHQC